MLLCVYWETNSIPHDCSTSTFPTEPSPQSEMDGLMSEFQTPTSRRTIHNCVSRFPCDQACACDMFRLWLFLSLWLWYEHFQCFLSSINISRVIDRLAKINCQFSPSYSLISHADMQQKPGSPTVGLWALWGNGLPPTVTTTVETD